MRYFDWNASTPLLPSVAELLGRRAAELTGNPSSVHQAGRASRSRLQAARDTVARALGCEPREVCFTGSGSEGAALAVKGAFEGRTDRGKTRVVTSHVEHPCVLGSVQQLEGAGAEVVRVAPDAEGRVSLQAMLAALTESTAVCSLMWANNETGVLQPVAEVARACQQRGIVFHTDAVQVVGKQPVSLREVPADLLSISAHKFGGPQGVGALVARRSLNLQALVPGHQEDGRRGGTQAVMMAEALALALGQSAEAAPAESARLTALRERFEAALLRLPEVRLNGGAAPRITNTSNVRFEGADGEALLIALDLEGFAVSSGAACASGSLKPSHVLTAMGLTPRQAQGSLRFSMGRLTTEADVDALLQAVARHLPAARDSST